MPKGYTVLDWLHEFYPEIWEKYQVFRTNRHREKARESIKRNEKQDQ